MEFSKKLRELRLQREMSLSQVAKNSGVNKGYLSSLETGRQNNPSRSKLDAICKVLGVQLNYFSDEHDPEKPDPQLSLPPGLKEYIQEQKRDNEKVPAEEIEDLAKISFRGVHSFSARDYALLHSNLKVLWKNRDKK